MNNNTQTPVIEQVDYSRWNPTHPLDMRGKYRPILIWRFHDAPEELQNLSINGGDEDWLAMFPSENTDYWPMWAKEGTPFGCCSVDRIVLPGGGFVLIGSHA